MLNLLLPTDKLLAKRRSLEAGSMQTLNIETMLAARIPVNRLD